MKCSCCGRKRRFLESFEELGTGLNICVDCSKLLYKYQDYRKEQNLEDAAIILESIKGKKHTKEFEAWLNSFLSRFEKKTDKEEVSEEIQSESDGKSIT